MTNYRFSKQRDEGLHPVLPLITHSAIGTNVEYTGRHKLPPTYRPHGRLFRVHVQSNLNDRDISGLHLCTSLTHLLSTETEMPF